LGGMTPEKELKHMFNCLTGGIQMGIMGSPDGTGACRVVAQTSTVTMPLAMRYDNN
jgi:hypothetical protein